jgi:predicted nucleotidyltransferase
METYKLQGEILELIRVVKELSAVMEIMVDALDPTKIDASEISGIIEVITAAQNTLKNTTGGVPRI